MGFWNTMASLVGVPGKGDDTNSNQTALKVMRGAGTLSQMQAANSAGAQGGGGSSDPLSAMKSLQSAYQQFRPSAPAAPAAPAQAPNYFAPGGAAPGQPPMQLKNPFTPRPVDTGGQEWGGLT